MAFLTQPGGLPAGGYVSPYANPVDYGYGKNFTPTEVGGPSSQAGGMNLMTFLQGLFGGNNPTPQRNPLNFALGDFFNRLFPSGTSVRESQAAQPLQPQSSQEVMRLGNPLSFSNLKPDLGRVSDPGRSFDSGPATPQPITPAPQPITPSPDASGATQFQDVLAANNGDVQRSVAAWNALQAKTTGFANSGSGAPRIIGWNWGQPLYAGQSAQGNPGNPTGYGPGGLYTAYKPANDPYSVVKHSPPIVYPHGVGAPPIQRSLATGMRVR